MFDTLVTTWNITTGFDEVRTLTLTLTPTTEIGLPIAKV